MVLKTLEMVGFKSFAEKTIVQFHQGMTAVVGPNGCGKSNILDAIRWVLGEQSAKALRGGSMQDVIFNGTDDRPPLGMAEVSLTFTDCEKELGTDYHEVRVTRRVFRDGQGEYEINKTPCRLRDVQQLFMDTGIGRSAYSMMEQGKIDAILSSKPEERRAVFEEAAGITRFKSQRREALRKLDQTEANLLRVADIIKEVNRQIGSLQRQAAKARRYRENSEKLKELDTRLAARQFHELNASVQAGRQTVDALKAELNGLQEALETKESALREQRLTLEGVEDQIHAKQQEQARLTAEKEHAGQRKAFHEQRIEETNTSLERNRLEIAGTEEKIRFQKGLIENWQSDAARLTGELEELRSRLHQAQAGWQAKKAAVAECSREREEAESAVLSDNRKIESNRGRLSALEAQQRQFLLRIEKLQEDEADWETHAREIEQTTASSQTVLHQTEETRQTAETAVEANRDALRQASESLREKREAWETLQSEKTSLEARKHALEQLASAQEGYSDGTKQLLERRRGQGLRGTLLEHIRVQPGFENAVNACLGTACEALLVEDAGALETLIAELGDKQGAVFVLPETLSTTRTGATHRPESAVRFVEAEALIQGWVQSLLANCYIVEDAAQAETLRRELPFAFIATRAGEVWHPDGWQLRGQAQDAHTSILTRHHELRELTQKLKSMADDLHLAKVNVETARASVERAETELQNSRQHEQESRAAENSARYELEFHQKRQAEWSDRKEAIQQEKNRLAEQDQSALEEQKQLAQEIESLTQTREERLQRIEELGETLSQLNAEAETQGQTVMDLRIQTASAEQSRESLLKQEEPLRQRLAELEDALSARSREIEDYQNRLAESREAIASAEQTISQADERAVEVAQAVEVLNGEKMQQQVELQFAENELKTERKHVAELQSRSSREEIALAEHQMHLDALVQRVERAYQVRLDETTELPETEEANWNEIEAQVTELRDKLDRMGPVNLEAITEFEELEQRQKFLISQEQDLVESKKQLASTIKKLNETTKVMFAETFEKIQKNFSQVFVELFGGGRASISLLNEEDLLESGIEITAKPPGKQPQSISLLSGGERAMTAVALLFSIYMVKPSPFCILDEMDAPLDESNISRFTQMLKRFLEQSQFVVITHNKKTIAEADVIHGVTMEDRGISRMISVRLSAKEKQNGRSEHEERSAVPASERIPAEEEPTLTS